MGMHLGENQLNKKSSSHSSYQNEGGNPSGNGNEPRASSMSSVKYKSDEDL
jgi:MFS family permease